MKRALAVVALLVGALGAAAEEPSADQVRAWIVDLDCDDFARREEATARLMEVGPAGEKLLREAQAGATPEAGSRIHRILDIISWGLPSPYRARLEPVLAGYAGATPEGRIEILGEAFSEWQGTGTVGPHLLAGAYVRENDQDHPLVKEFVLGRIRENPAAWALTASLLLRGSPGAGGVARVANLVEAALSAEVPRDELLPVAGVVCAALDRAGLGDLSTPGVAMDLLQDRKAAASANARAAAAFTARGMDLEELLALRRVVLLDPEVTGAWTRLEELCEGIGCGAAHLALLRWTDEDWISEDAREALEAQIEKWTGVVSKGGGSPPDLSSCLRLRRWTPVPLTKHVLVGRRAIYVAGSHPHRVQSPDVFAHDRQTGDILWTFAPPPEPSTRIEMAGDLGGSLFETAGGLIVLHEVTSDLGNGGSLGHTARRTRATLLSGEGRVLWSREYDLDPGLRFLPIDDATAMFVPPGHQHRGRGWGVRLADGQVVSTARVSSAVFPVAGGRVLTEYQWSGRIAMIDASTGKFVWDQDRIGISTFVNDPVCFVEGEAVYVATGRHVARLRARDGACEWVHAFDPDETTIAPIARAGEALVVLDTGGKTWTVVTLDPSSGEERSRRELPRGDDPSPSGRPPSGWEVCRWVAPDVFALRGRLVDLVAGRVMSREGLVGPARQQASDEDAWGLRVSDGAEPIVFVSRGGLVAEVNPGSGLVDVKKVMEAIREARKTAAAAAEAMESLLRDWDPSAVPPGEGQDGK